MIKDNIFALVVAMIYLAILYTLVRPGSKGPSLVSNISNALSDLIRGSIGYTFDQSTGKWNPP